MAFKDILAEVSADCGVDINSPTQKAWLIAKINSAAKDLYTQNDLIGCLREQMFEIGSEDQQISLPYYVFELRGVRDYETQTPMKLFDMSPRYQTEGWVDQAGLYSWRIKRQGSPTKTLWLCDGEIKFTLSKVASKDFTINVIGKTNQASRIQETVTVTAGTLEVWTTNAFVAGGIDSISKSDVTDEDITVKAVDDTVIAEIPNCEISPSYTIVQVMDRDQSRSQSQIVETLYKIRFTPFANDYDQFPCGDIYDEAIYWQSLAQIWAKNEGEQWVAKVIAADGKAKETINSIATNRSAGRKARMDFGPSRWTNHVRQVWNHRWNINRYFR